MEKIVKTFTKSLVQGVGLSLGLSIFVLGIFLVKGIDPLTATDGETLTATKWNALVNQVNNSSADRVCPSGFVSVGSGYQLGCLQSDLNSSQTWLNAAQDCLNRFGGKLPSGNERYIAALKNGINIQQGGFERVDSFFYSVYSTLTYRYGLINYSTTGIYRGTGATETESYPYRCFIPR